MSELVKRRRALIARRDAKPRLYALMPPRY